MADVPLALDSTAGDRRWHFRFVIAESVGVSIMTCAGRLGQAAADELVGALGEAVANGRTRHVFDFARVDYISSAGLGPLGAFAESVKAEGGEVVLCGLSVPVRLAFDLAGLIPQFTIAATVDEAIARLARADGDDPPA